MRKSSYRYSRAEKRWREGKHGGSEGAAFGGSQRPVRKNKRKILRRAEYEPLGTGHTTQRRFPEAVRASDQQLIDLMSSLLDHTREKVEEINRHLDDTQNRIFGTA